MTKGLVNSIQTLGTLDGPGVRFVVFMQGCNLRCGCCHNPDTWAMHGGVEYTPYEIVEKAVRYREYFGNEGGITISGGEPLLQAAFVREVFDISHSKGINTCLDTSGCVLNSEIVELLNYTDRVLLDIKYYTEDMYRKYVGCGIDAPLDFLQYINKLGIPVTLRQVIIPTLNDNSANVGFINDLIAKNPCIDKVELLPFKKMCRVKYQNMGIEFRFDSYDEPSKELVSKLYSEIIIA